MSSALSDRFADICIYLIDPQICMSKSGLLVRNTTRVFSLTSCPTPV